jgi:hypothetical protein
VWRRCRGSVRRFVEQAAHRLQLGPQPGQGPAAQPRLVLVVEFVRVLALAAAGQGGSAGRVVAVGVQCFRQLPLGGESFLVEAGGGRVLLAV